MKFILLHDAKNDDGVRAFFMDVWELYIKVTNILAFSLRCLIKYVQGGYESLSYSALDDQKLKF